MKKGKVGCTPTFTAASDPTERVTTFQKGLVAPNGFIIDCEMYQWCLLCPILSGTDALHAFVYEVFGTQTSGSLGQSIDFAFNYKIFKAQATRIASVIPPQNGAQIKDGVNTVGLIGHSLYDNYVGAPNNDLGYDFLQIGDSNVSVDESDGLSQEGKIGKYHTVNFPSRLQNSPSASGYQDIRAGTNASSADLPAGNAAKNYIINPQKQTSSFSLDANIIPWLAVPCGIFNFLQLEIKSVTSTNESAMAYTLIG